MATPNIEDVLFAVQRNNELKNCKGSDLKDNLQDGDLLAVTRGDVTYKLEVEGPMPWEGFNGGVFHIKDVVEVGTGSQGTIRFNTTCQAWTISGNDLGLIDEYSGTDEIVIATSDTEYLFKGNSGNEGINWNFGEETDTSEVTTMFGMFYNCRKFNGQLGGNWDTSNVESMFLMFFNAREFNQPVGDWVTSKVTNMEAAFYSARGFNQPIGDWDTSSVENMNSMLANTHAFNQYIGDWDTSSVTDMSEMLSGCTVFDQDIGNWDVSNVVNMYNMVSSCNEFNQDLSNWCVTNIPSEPPLWDNNTPAWVLPNSRPCWGHCPRGENGTIDPCPVVMPWEGWEGGIWHIKNATSTVYLSTRSDSYTAWDIDGTNSREITAIQPDEELVFVTDPYRFGLFFYEEDDKGNDADWDFGELTDTSKVEDFFALFLNCRNFNGQLGGNWDTSNVEDMSDMFKDATAFNQDIGGWDVTNVREMVGMFDSAKAFNQDIGDWVMTGVRDLGRTFIDAEAFNQDIGRWDTSNVWYMNETFKNTRDFNQDIGNWNISEVENLNSMFAGAKAFNKDIGNWDVSYVDRMDSTFKDAQVFNQNLSDWCVTKIPSQPDNFDNGAAAWDRPKPCWGHCPPQGDPCPDPPDPICDGVDSSTPTAQVLQESIGPFNRYKAICIQPDKQTGGYISIAEERDVAYYIQTMDANGNETGRCNLPGSTNSSNKTELFHFDQVNRKAVVWNSNLMKVWFIDVPTSGNPTIWKTSTLSGIPQGQSMYHRPLWNLATDNGSNWVVNALNNVSDGNYPMLKFDTVAGTYSVIDQIAGTGASELGWNGGYRINNNKMILLDAPENDCYLVDSNNTTASGVQKLFGPSDKVYYMNYVDELQTIFVTVDRNSDETRSFLAEIDLDGNVIAENEVISLGCDDTIPVGFNVFVNSTGQKCAVKIYDYGISSGKLYVYQTDRGMWYQAKQSPWWANILHYDYSNYISASYARDIILSPSTSGDLGRATFPS